MPSALACIGLIVVANRDNHHQAPEQSPRHRRDYLISLLRRRLGISAPAAILTPRTRCNRCLKSRSRRPREKIAASDRLDMPAYLRLVACEYSGEVVDLTDDGRDIEA